MPELTVMEPSEPGRASAARFLAFALLAGFAFFIPFFLRAGAPRFAFLDFFARFNLPIGLKNMPIRPILHPLIS